jgi:transcriptional regulator with XRE-family HTH domain
MGQESIKNLRNQKGWSQSELAEMSSLSVKTIQRVENGLVEPSLETAKALGSVFDRPFSEFLPPKEVGAQMCGDVASSEDPTLSSANVSAPENSLYAPKRHLKPALVVFFLLVSAGILIKIYWGMEALSGDVAEIANLRDAESVTEEAGGNSLFRSNLAQETGVFSDYYGNYVTAVLRPTDWEKDGDYGASLIENKMLRDVARIISAWERSGGASSDIGSDNILRSNLQCYRDARSQSDSAIESIEKMQYCIYRVLSDANWRLSHEVDLVLKNVAREYKKTTPFYRALRVEPLQLTKG